MKTWRGRTDAPKRSATGTITEPVWRSKGANEGSDRKKRAVMKSCHCVTLVWQKSGTGAITAQALGAVGSMKRGRISLDAEIEVLALRS